MSRLRCRAIAVGRFLLSASAGQGEAQDRNMLIAAGNLYLDWSDCDLRYPQAPTPKTNPRDPDVVAIDPDHDELRKRSNIALPNVLPPGLFMPPGSQLTSASGNRYLLYRLDGNLVLYLNDGSGSDVWSSKTAGTSPNLVYLQPDGDLVILDRDWNQVWHSDTKGNNGAYLILQDDGNLVIYRHATGPHNNGRIWDTKTY